MKAGRPGREIPGRAVGAVFQRWCAVRQPAQAVPIAVASVRSADMSGTLLPPS